MCMVCDEDLETDHIDAVKAFTQAGIDKEVYVEMPEGFEVEGHVCLLKMALEGIKQGAYLWFALNRAAWLKLGWPARAETACKSPCLLRTTAHAAHTAV